jgi:hypothetical protein
MPQEDLAQRIQRLEDIEAIKNLKARYCLYCDDNFNVDKIVSLFTPDTEWVATSFGPFKGHDQLRDFWTNITKRLTFAIHYVSNPISKSAATPPTPPGTSSSPAPSKANRPSGSWASTTTTW